MYDTPRVATCKEFFEQTGKNGHAIKFKSFFFSDMNDLRILLLFFLMHYTVYGCDIYLHFTFIVHNDSFSTWGYSYYHSAQVSLSLQ